MGKYILFIRKISFFCIFFASKLYLVILYFVKKNSKKKIGSPSEMGFKTKVFQCE